jgi:hypothetical protein
MLGTDQRDGQSPFGFGTDAVVGLAVVVQIAGELISGAVALLAQDNLYGAAALLRQLAFDARGRLRPQDPDSLPGQHAR